MSSYRVWLLIILLGAACNGETDEATLVTKTSARLNAKNISCQSGCTSYYEYSTLVGDVDGTSGTPSNSPTVQRTPITSGVPVATVTGLTPNTRYHFRICGKEGSWTGYLCSPVVKSFVTMEPIALSADRQSFVTATTQAPFAAVGTVFHPTGTNEIPFENYFDSDLGVIEQDMLDQRALGANTLRMKLPICRLMSGPSQWSAAGQARLDAIVRLAETHDLYLDFTGLVDQGRASSPCAWYEPLDEAGRWSAQEFFWSGFAERYGKSPATFAYGLIDEPGIPSSPVTTWRFGTMGNDPDPVVMCNYLVKDKAGRTSADIYRIWMQRMKAAIRAKDAKTLITLPIIPKRAPNGGSTADAAWAAEVDFLAPHMYPATDEIQNNVDAIKEYRTLYGKPVVNEETAMMSAAGASYDWFVKATQPYTVGNIIQWHRPPPEPWDIAEALAAAGRAYLLDNAAMLKKAVPNDADILHFHSQIQGDHFYTGDPDDPSLTRRCFSYFCWDFTDYVFVDTTASTLLYSDGTAVPLLRLWNPSTQHQTYITDGSQATLADYESRGFYINGVVGFVYRTQVSGTSPLYRYTHQTTGDTILTRFPSPYGYAYYGYLGQTIVGYVFPAP